MALGSQGARDACAADIQLMPQNQVEKPRLWLTGELRLAVN
jgi:hypothetical protein